MSARSLVNKFVTMSRKGYIYIVRSSEKEERNRVDPLEELVVVFC